jgi:hypothetical protein
LVHKLYKSTLAVIPAAIAPSLLAGN